MAPAPVQASNSRAAPPLRIHRNNSRQGWRSRCSSEGSAMAKAAPSRRRKREKGSSRRARLMARNVMPATTTSTPRMPVQFSIKRRSARRHNASSADFVAGGSREPTTGRGVRGGSGDSWCGGALSGSGGGLSGDGGSGLACRPISRVPSCSSRAWMRRPHCCSCCLWSRSSCSSFRSRLTPVSQRKASTSRTRDNRKEITLAGATLPV